MQKVVNGSTVRYWACINFSRSVQESTVHGFCQDLVHMCEISGMVNFLRSVRLGSNC
jgi:eukaryotic translation initiation factor 2C